MCTELAEGCVVQLAVQGHVVLDLLAGVQPVKDVTLQVRVDGIALVQAVQRDPMERQWMRHVLTRTKGEEEMDRNRKTFNELLCTEETPQNSKDNLGPHYLQLL